MRRRNYKYVPIIEKMECEENLLIVPSTETIKSDATETIKSDELIYDCNGHKYDSDIGKKIFLEILKSFKNIYGDDDIIYKYNPPLGLNYWLKDYVTHSASQKHNNKEYTSIYLKYKILERIKAKFIIDYDGFPTEINIYKFPLNIYYGIKYAEEVVNLNCTIKQLKRSIKYYVPESI